MREAVSNHGSTFFFFPVKSPSAKKKLHSLLVHNVEQTLLLFQGWLSFCCSEDSLLCVRRDKREQLTSSVHSV